MIVGVGEVGGKSEVYRASWQPDTSGKVDVAVLSLKAETQSYFSYLVLEAECLCACAGGRVGANLNLCS